MAEALATVGDIVRDVRVLLQDTRVPYRYSDAELVNHLNMGMQEARRLRADLFLPLFDVPFFDTSGAVTMTAPVAIDAMYRPSFVYYVVGLAQLRDDEPNVDQRAGAFTGKFLNQMLGINA